MKQRGLVNCPGRHMHLGTAVLWCVLIYFHVENSEAWGSFSPTLCSSIPKNIHGNNRGRYGSVVAMVGFRSTTAGNFRSGRVSPLFTVTDKNSNSSLESSLSQGREKLLLEELETLTEMFESLQSSVKSNSELFQRKLESKQQKVDELKSSLLSTEKEQKYLLQKLESMKDSSIQSEQELKEKIQNLESRMKEEKKESDQKMKDYVRDNANHVQKARQFQEQKHKKAKEDWQKAKQALESKNKELQTESTEYRDNMEKRIAQLHIQKDELKKELMQSEEKIQSIRSHFASIEATQNQQNKKSKQTEDMQQQIIIYEAERNSLRKLIRLMFRRMTYILRIRRRKNVAE